MDITNISSFLIPLLVGSIQLAVPLLVPGIGEIFVERSGVINLGIEGIMLVGALIGMIFAFFSQSIWYGVIAAIISGMLLSLLLAFWTITLKANQVISGFALTIIGGGLSVFLYRVVFGIRSIPPKVEPLPAWNIPIFSKIPVLGEIFFQQSPLVYVAYVLIPIAAIILYKTKFGLSIRAVGENPAAADTKGINVFSTRYICLLIGGACAGFGGAFLSLAFLGTFYSSMTAGRGYIAMAIAILCRWDPVRAIWAALLFGGAYALQFRVQALNSSIPYQLLVALPYIITLIVLIGISRQTQLPSALTIPYSRGHKE